MGKSDVHLFPIYKAVVKEKHWKSIGFFGFEKRNNLTDFFIADNKDFYDLSLNNWNINSFPYVNKENYDLIVCTRVAYFAKDPLKMIDSFKKMLNPGGKILIDWGLGDHWRFDNYKIGWVKGDEHEWCYEKDNYLWSSIWHDSMINDNHFKKFTSDVKKLGYDSVKSAIFEEVPVVTDIEDIARLGFDINYTLLSLWEDKPQLYIILLLTSI